MVTQNSGLSKRFVDSRNSIVSDNILLFTEKLNLCNPYNKSVEVHHHDDSIKFQYYNSTMG